MVTGMELDFWVMACSLIFSHHNGSLFGLIDLIVFLGLSWVFICQRSRAERNWSFDTWHKAVTLVPCSPVNGMDMDCNG